MARRAFVLVALVATGMVLAGCGSDRAPTPPLPRALVLEARPIGSGNRFRPPVRGPVGGRCERRLGPRSGVHVELFAEDRVVIVAAGIGTTPPRTFVAGRISTARCYGDVATLEPTGLVLVRRGLRPPLADLFRAWGQPLSQRQVASFAAPPGTRPLVFVDGKRWRGSPRSVPLAPHAEIVLELGPYVPPHASYLFPRGA